MEYQHSFLDETYNPINNHRELKTNYSSITTIGNKFDCTIKLGLQP